MYTETANKKETEELSHLAVPQNSESYKIQTKYQWLNDIPQSKI